MNENYSYGVWIFMVIIIAAIALISLIAQWKIYEKAGKPGWAVLIPFYNIIVLLEIVDKPIWWLFLFLIPGVNMIFGIWATNLLSKSFEKGVAFTIGLIFLPFIFYPILGFDSAKYVGPAGK